MSLTSVIFLCAVAGGAVLLVRAVGAVKRGSDVMLESYAHMLERARAAAMEESQKSDSD